MERVSQVSGALLIIRTEDVDYPAGCFSGAAPRRELGCEAKNFVAAPSSTLRMPARLLPLAKGSCPFEVSIPFDATLRGPASASTISYIKHSKMKTPGGRIACGALAPVYNKRFRKFRLKINLPNRRERERENASSIICALIDAVLTGGAPLCAGNAPGRASASRARLPFERRVIRLRGVAKLGAPHLLTARAQRLELSVISIQAREKAQ